MGNHREIIGKIMGKNGIIMGNNGKHNEKNNGKHDEKKWEIMGNNKHVFFASSIFNGDRIMGLNEK
jgi:hypothetical protein